MSGPKTITQICQRGLASMEIVVTGSMPFSAEQVRRLQRVGRVTTAGGAASGDEWLKQVEGADVVCSDGMFVAGNLERLHDVFVTFPFVEIGSVGTHAPGRRDGIVAYAPRRNPDPGLGRGGVLARRPLPRVSR